MGISLRKWYSQGHFSGGGGEEKKEKMKGALQL